MEHEARQLEAIRLMADFAERTGLKPGREQKRYLWTDAFAVVNFLALHHETGDERYLEEARDLIDAVHHVLGRHRADDPREGWLSGLGEEEGARHPTVGGLRIGKPLPERAPDDPVDERLEWERDGQYFHYLTRWIDALWRASRVLKEAEYRRQTIEMSRSVFPRFLTETRTGEPAGLIWKMSIDLSRPLVSGISPHDALDGYVCFRQLSQRGMDPPALLDGEIEILRELATGGRWATRDPLGLGGLLLDAYRLAVLPERTASDEKIIPEVLAGAAAGLQSLMKDGTLETPAAHRLAFRELGLAIGLQTLAAVSRVARDPSLSTAVTPHLQSLEANAHVGGQIIGFWQRAGRRNEQMWREHEDINEVMLATALLRAHTRAI